MAESKYWNCCGRAALYVSTRQIAFERRSALQPHVGSDMLPSVQYLVLSVGRVPSLSMHLSLAKLQPLSRPKNVGVAAE